MARVAPRFAVSQSGVDTVEGLTTVLHARGVMGWIRPKRMQLQVGMSERKVHPNMPYREQPDQLGRFASPV